MQEQMSLFSPGRRIKSLGGAGILSRRDVNELSGGVMRVLDLMFDGEWHDAEEIKRAAGDGVNPASEGLRRLRELRRCYTIERRRDGSGRNFEYRLLSKS